MGTYPPTRCGIATFTASLRRALVSAAPGIRVGVVALVDGDQAGPVAREVVAPLARGSAASLAAAREALAGFGVVVVQHEFGIYGGPDGAEVVDLVRGLDRPLIVVLHTVPRSPTPQQTAIIEQLAATAARLVVQSEAARTRLLEQYEVEAELVCTIPHGARNNLAAPASRPGRGRSSVVLTWGLLGRDKGIECGIEAIARLTDLDPAPRYLVVGETHPRVLEAFGESYRDSLVALAARLGVGDLVEFDDAYHDTRSLLERVREADLVLLPYHSREQVVSGVLVEALASGKPVVATRFPHAEELLSHGSGLLVPHADPDEIAAALRWLLTDPALAASAAAAARAQASTFFWESVGERYLALAREVARRPARASALALPPPPFRHLFRLGDEVGVFEHAKLTERRRPGRSHPGWGERERGR